MRALATTRRPGGRFGEQAGQNYCQAGAEENERGDLFPYPSTLIPNTPRRAPGRHPMQPDKPLIENRIPNQDVVGRATPLWVGLRAKMRRTIGSKVSRGSVS